jgi:hypothetical protein
MVRQYGQLTAEKEQPTNQFRKDMLAAFRHGIEFELLESDGESEVDPKTMEDKNLAFAEWFNKHYLGKKAMNIREVTISTSVRQDWEAFIDAIGYNDLLWRIVKLLRKVLSVIGFDGRR